MRKLYLRRERELLETKLSSRNLIKRINSILKMDNGGLVWLGFYGISTIIGYLMPNPLYINILNIYDLVGFG